MIVKFMPNQNVEIEFDPMEPLLEEKLARVFTALKMKEYPMVAFSSKEK